MKGPLPDALRPLTVPASWVYGLAVSARNRRYDRGAGVLRVPLPVVSVGNVTAGGTGKTPMVAWICGCLAKRGRRPIVAMRGYGARAGAPSDEQFEYTERLPGVPIVAGADRAAALRGYLAQGGAGDCVVLDDGFQHRGLHRDLDLVLIDATRSTMRDRLLPVGWLREPLSSLRRASAVIVTRAEGVDEALAADVERHHGRPPSAWTRHAWTELSVFEPADPAGHHADVQWLRGRRVVTMLGVGNPVAIIAQLERAGAEVLVNVPVRDHQRYGAAQLATAARLCADADALVTTGKDWAKLRGLIGDQRCPVPIVVPRVVIEVFDGRQALEELISKKVHRGDAESAEGAS